MKRKVLIIFLLIAALVFFGLGSCFSNKGPDEIRNPRNSLDWEGVYTGSFLSHTGHILDVRMKLNRDQSFEKYFEYADGAYEPGKMRGPFKWDDTGSIIMIDVIDAPMQYKVAKNKLIRLDAYDYVLVKER